MLRDTFSTHGYPGFLKVHLLIGLIKVHYYKLNSALNSLIVKKSDRSTLDHFNLETQYSRPPTFKEKHPC